jgi:hypothetical protein
MKVAKSLRSTPRVGAACTVRRFVLLCWRAAGAADHGTAPVIENGSPIENGDFERFLAFV